MSPAQGTAQLLISEEIKVMLYDLTALRIPQSRHIHVLNILIFGEI